MNVLQRIKGLLEIQAALGRFQKAWAEYQTAKDKDMSLSIGQLLKSRVFWTGIAGFAFNAWDKMSNDPTVLGVHVSAPVVTAINGAIALGIAVFRMFPNQGVPK